jgi:hypothetical protein
MRYFFLFVNSINNPKSTANFLELGGNGCELRARRKTLVPSITWGRKIFRPYSSLKRSTIFIRAALRICESTVNTDVLIRINAAIRNGVKVMGVLVLK